MSDFSRFSRLKSIFPIISTVSLKSLFPIACFAILFFSITSFTYKSIAEWKLAKSKNGIKVYTRSVPGYQLKEYKCEMISDASIELLTSILKDYSDHKNWGGGLSESTILNQTKDDDFHVYFRNPAPWPVSDRDIITHFQWENWSDGIVNIKMSAAPDYIAHKDGLVRITFMNGYWRLSPMADGRVLVVTSAHADPGGNIPDWLANAGVVDIPYDTMLGLKKRAALER